MVKTCMVHLFSSTAVYNVESQISSSQFLAVVAKFKAGS